jgi:hypothetical protein
MKSQDERITLRYLAFIAVDFDLNIPKVLNALTAYVLPRQKYIKKTW